MSMPSIDDKHETEEEDMEQETPETDKSEDEDSETGTGSEEEEDESSDLDEEECEKRRDEYVDDMTDLERQFSDLKEQLYLERMSQVESKLEEVRAGKAAEYLDPLAQLQENMRIRTQVAGILRELRIACIKNKFEAEEQAANQNYESEKIMLYDTVKAELEEKIRRLEEDRHNIDIDSDLWESQNSQKKNRRKSDPNNPDRRKKPVVISGPYIVYMLSDTDVIEDWTAIKKALKQQQQIKKRPILLS